MLISPITGWMTTSSPLTKCWTTEETQLLTCCMPSPESGNCGYNIVLFQPKMTVLIYIISHLFHVFTWRRMCLTEEWSWWVLPDFPGLLLVWPILMKRCSGKPLERPRSPWTMRRNGNWAGVSYGSLRFCRRFWMTCFSTLSVIISMSWQLLSLNFMIAAIVWRKIGKLVSAMFAGHIAEGIPKGIYLNWV